MAITTQGALTDDDGNPEADVYLHDYDTGTTELVSLGVDGSPANGESDDVRLSANGEFIVFSSRAENLVDGDNNGKMDVFRYEIATGQTEIVSVGSDGAPGDASSFRPSVSADGNLISFESDMNSLAGPDAPLDNHVFVKNMETGVLQVADRESDGSFLGEKYNNLDSVLSGDGSVVVFSVELADTFEGEKLFVKNLETGALTVVDTPGENFTVSRLDVNDDGSAFIVSQWSGPAEIYEYSSGTLTQFEPTYPPEINSETTNEVQYIEGGERFVASVANFSFSQGECPDTIYVTDGSTDVVTMVPATFDASRYSASDDGSKLVFASLDNEDANWFLHRVEMP